MNIKRLLVLCGFVVASALPLRAQNLSASSPAGVPGAALWLKADDGVVKSDDEGVSAWQDQSGHQVNALQSGA